jgi:polyisoprenoid-binding protein YceI
VKITPAAGNKLTIEGDLTVKNVTKRISVPASMMFYDKGVGRFRGQFTILRKDFGITYDAMVNPIENEVQVQWDIAIKEPAPAK